MDLNDSQSFMNEVTILSVFLWLTHCRSPCSSSEWHTGHRRCKRPDSYIHRTHTTNYAISKISYAFSAWNTNSCPVSTRYSLTVVYLYWSAIDHLYKQFCDESLEVNTYCDYHQVLKTTTKTQAKLKRSDWCRQIRSPWTRHHSCWSESCPGTFC